MGFEEPCLKTRSPQDVHILELAEPVAEALGLEIVRVRVMGGKKTTCQIMTERHDGDVNVADCARLSRALSAVFEEVDPIADEYDLEVSSPGIDRPLTTLAHFARWEGFEAKLELDRLVEGRKRYRGLLAGVEDNNVLIDLAGEEETAVIPFDWISDAKLVLTDALLAESLKGRTPPPADIDGDFDGDDAGDNDFGGGDGGTPASND
jgi:ribosome maturation factor RimP